MERCALCKEEDTALYEDGVPVCLKCANERENKASQKPSSAQSVQNILVEQIVEATNRVNKATHAFFEVMGQVPTGFPHPDGSQRIHNASLELSTARKELMKAHTRLDDFLKKGIMPADARRSG